MTSAKNNHEKVLFIMTVSVIVGVVVFTVIIEPQLKERKALLAQMRQLKLKLTKMKGDLLIKDRVDNAYSQVEQFIASNGTNQQEISLFTRELSDLYSKLNVKTKTIKILPVINEEFYQKLSVKIEMSGHIREILNFILCIDEFPKPIKIEQFDIKAREIVDNIHVSFLVTKIVATPQA